VAPRKPSASVLFRDLNTRSTRSSGSNPLDDPALQAFWNVISMIPRGVAVTYGEVARAAGFPGRARQAGRALRLAPQDMHLPWHRVVAAGGRIAFPRLSKEHRVQARLLRAEGVVVKDGRVARTALVTLDAL
jgi:methylated-DNA-protein-cysteine methyltransferase related protein